MIHQPAQLTQHYANLPFLTQKIIDCFASGKSCLGIFFDIAKAFDKLWHKGVITKMINAKIPR
jgi:hypothetical protein